MSFSTPINCTSRAKQAVEGCIGNGFDNLAKLPICVLFFGRGRSALVQLGITLVVIGVEPMLSVVLSLLVHTPDPGRSSTAYAFTCGAGKKMSCLASGSATDNDFTKRESTKIIAKRCSSRVGWSALPALNKTKSLENPTGVRNLCPWQIVIVITAGFDDSEIKDTDKLKKKSTVQIVVDTLLTQISTGKLLPGQSVIVQDLMDELNVSKAPVREAIHTLVGEGLIELVQNRSAKIRRLTHDDLIAFTEVWAAVGGVNVRLGSNQIEEGDNRALIKNLLNDILKTEQTKNSLDFYSAVTAFHYALSKISANSYITETIKRANFDFFHRNIRLIFPGRYWRRHIVAFEKIGAAVLSGNGIAAERHYRKHMQWLIEHMQSIR